MVNEFLEKFLKFQKILEFDANIFLNANNSSNSNINGSNVNTGASEDVMKILLETFKILQEQQGAIINLLKNNNKIVS